MEIVKSSVPFISKDVLDPGSAHMGVMGLLYKQSYMLKEFKEMLTEEYEFSYWVPNVLFAVACILLGFLAAFFVLLPGLLSVSPLKIPFIVIILTFFYIHSGHFVLKSFRNWKTKFITLDYFVYAGLVTGKLKVTLMFMKERKI